MRRPSREAEQHKEVTTAFAAQLLLRSELIEAQLLGAAAVRDPGGGETCWGELNFNPGEPHAGAFSSHCC